jgi:hypothetical protein
MKLDRYTQRHYDQGRADADAGKRFCPPDFRTNAENAQAYRQGYMDADRNKRLKERLA